MRDPGASRRSITIQLVIVVIIWGLNYSVTKWSLREIPPLAFTALRFAAASVILLVILKQREGTIRIPAGGLFRLTALGIIGNTVYQICFILGLSWTTATNSALVLASMPALVGAAGHVLGIERLTVRRAGGLAAATVGVLLVVAARGVSFKAETFRGDVITVAAVGCWAVFTLGVRQLRLPMSPLAITAWTTVLGTPLLVAAALPSLLRTSWTTVSLTAWGGLAYSSLLSLVVAYVLWNNALRVIGSARTVVFACATPLIAMASAMLILGERPLLIQLVGAVGILGGVVLSSPRNLPPARPEAALESADSV
jgi:drug/metabolite transporter (DMT)-like permease